MVLVTVVRGDRRRDLAVRGDVPIADLLGPLADALAHDPGAAARDGKTRGPTAPPLAPAPGSGASLPPLPLAPVSGPTPGPLALAPVCGVGLPPERSLEACGVGHGAVLVLLD
jgi:WXG100 protein secretion system (Wss), protein YukD